MLSKNTPSHKGKDAPCIREFNKDLQKALDEVIFAIAYIEQVDIPACRKEFKFKKRAPKCLKQAYPTSVSFFDVMMWWPGGVVQKIENIATQRARTALASMRKIVEEVDEENPDLNDRFVLQLYDLQLYEQKRLQHKPGQRKNDRPDLRPTDEGGTS